MTRAGVVDAWAQLPRDPRVFGPQIHSVLESAGTMEVLKGGVDPDETARPRATTRVSRGSITSRDQAVA